MKHIYDILRVDSQGPTWMGTAMDFESAKTMVAELNKLTPRRYIIQSNDPGEDLVRSGTATGFRLSTYSLSVMDSRPL